MRICTYIATFIFTILSTLATAQPQSVKFNKTIHDFGDIMLNSGSHKHTFTFENVSDNPLVIQTVVSSCGCAAPIWTKKPVMPGEKGTIEVTFMNDQGPYPFDKSLTVYITGEPRPVILRIRGVVHAKPKKLKELFPEDFNGLSFRKSYLDLGHLAMGDVIKESIEAANTSSEQIKVDIKCKSPGIEIELQPGTLKKGETTLITFTVNSTKAESWGTTEFYADVYVNGIKVSDKQLKAFASIRDNFSGLTKQEKALAPLPMAETSTYDFGTIKEGTKVNATFKIRNLGQRTLIIHKAESGSEKIKIDYPKQTEPGKQNTISLEMETSGNKGEISYIISLITNSPSRPVMNLIVTGLVQ